MLVPNSNLEQIFSNAVATAKQYKHEYVTIEHMMFAMLKDPGFIEFLQDFGIKVELMGKDVARYLETELDSIKTKAEVTTPKKTAGLERVFNRCFTSVLFLGKDEIEPIDIFLSMFSEDKSFVAFLMKKYKLNKLFAGVADKNLGSKKVLEKNNFKLEGIRKKHLFINNKFYNQLDYGLLL